MTAPVLPALTTADAPPSFTRRKATRIEESFFRRSARLGASSMSIVSEAWTIGTWVSEAPQRRSSDSSASRRPTSTGASPSSRAAWTAPSTMLAGAKSPPIASTAILTGSGRSKRSRPSDPRPYRPSRISSWQPRSRRAPYSIRSADRSDEEACPPDSWGIWTALGAPGRRGFASCRGAAWSAFVWDWASLGSSCRSRGRVGS